MLQVTAATGGYGRERYEKPELRKKVEAGLQILEGLSLACAVLSWSVWMDGCHDYSCVGVVVCISLGGG